MKYVVGLMSGTSLDGIDAALVKIDENKNEELNIKIVNFLTIPFNNRIRSQLLDCCDEKNGTVDKICRMNFKIGELFAEVVYDLIDDSEISIDKLNLIGSHGQTVYHDVISRDFKSTLQIGAAGIIAERTGITTISNFRMRDIAAGGEGAPLVPYVDFMLFKSKRKNKVLQNIGGIGNYTYIPVDGDIGEVKGSDTGPGNMLIDTVISSLTESELKFDKDGKWAAKGNTNHYLLELLKTHPFFEKPFPKTTGRETFGNSFANKIIKQSKKLNLGRYDIVATVTSFSAWSIVEAYSKGIEVIEKKESSRNKIDQIIISGGGASNPTLVNMINYYSTKMLKSSPQIITMEDIGYSSEAKEAIAFAVLAYQTMKGRASNIPAVTGADNHVVLGNITPGLNFYKMLTW